MKRTIILPLTDEQLLELQRILLDEDKDAALRFLKKHLSDRVKGTLEGAGHCSPTLRYSDRMLFPASSINQPTSNYPI